MGTSTRAIQCEIEIDTVAISPASEKRKPSLTLEIPPRSGIARAPASATPSSGSGRPSAKKSVQFQSATESNTLTLGLKRLLTPRSARTGSLPLQFASPPSSSPRDHLISSSKIKRSKSVVEGQTKTKQAVTRVYSGTFLVKSSTPRPRPGDPYDNVDAAPSIRTDTPDDNGEEEIPVEEALCRICLCELGEEGSTLKLECQCKGDLALAHEECALKWFGIRGNRECDVCCHEVVNLPVTLVRMEQTQTSASQQAAQIAITTQSQARNWHDVPLLVMVIIITYFLFLEIILARRIETYRARFLALPFSILFGIFTTVTATALAKRGWMWFVAIFQLGYVILCGHVFLNWMGLNPVLSMSLAGFSGFGLSMMFYAVLLEYWSFVTRSRGADFYSA